MKPRRHHMATWKRILRSDRQDRLVERQCEHGIGHPDPDSLNDITARLGAELAKYSGIHGCDGCCRPTNPATLDQK